MISAAQTKTRASKRVGGGKSSGDGTKHGSQNMEMGIGVDRAGRLVFGCLCQGGTRDLT
jgi:hypothetical protein